MSVIDEVVSANQAYAKSFKQGALKMPPSRKLAVVACMDARLSVEELLGLKAGEAHIIRNAGGIVTDDALRSLLISHYLLGTQEFMIINHTDCGMLTFRDGDLSERLFKQTGAVPVAPVWFGAFGDVAENVRRQILKLKVHPWVPRQVTVRGFVDDVKSGKLTEMTAAIAAKGAA